MSINMNSLPSEKPAFGSVFPKGRYIARIVKSSMRTPKPKADGSIGNDYLVAECDITDPMTNQSMGKFWINLYESEANLVRYQLGRFINATGIKLQGEFELKDLTKLINNKTIMVDLMPEEKKDGSAPQRSVVDISAECFYPYVQEQRIEAGMPDDVFLNAVSTPTVQANY